MAEMYAKDVKLREPWDRLVLLLVAPPRDGWEHEFWAILRWELQQLAPPEEHEAGHDE
jgi:hypothetical protein